MICKTRTMEPHMRTERKLTIFKKTWKVMKGYSREDIPEPMTTMT